MRVRLLVVAVLLSALGAGLVATPASAGEEIAASEVVLHNVPKNSPFPARTVRVWIPKQTEYYVDAGTTIMNGFRTVRRLARSDGQRVYVKVRKAWVAVPYSYRGPGNVLHFEESLRIVMGLRRDPLGAPAPTYVRPPVTLTGPTAPEPRPVPSSPRFVDSAATTALLGAGWRDEMLARVNALRAQAGVAPAQMCLPLNDSATYKSQSMATLNYYSHDTPAGYPKAGEVAQESGGRGVSSENIAGDFRSVADVVEAWRTSPGHYANMTNPVLVTMGFGAAVSAGGKALWTQHFSRNSPC